MVSAVGKLGRGTSIAAIGAVALAAGLSACASSDSEPAEASPAVAEKQAAKGVYLKLEVVDSGTELGLPPDSRRKPDPPVTVTICGSGVCNPPREMKAGDVADKAAGGDVTGTIRYADGFTVDFSAGNPFVGYPWITIAPAAGNTCRGSQTTRLEEGETLRTGTYDKPICGYEYKLTRFADTDYKMMRIQFHG